MAVRDFRWLPLLIAVCGSPTIPVAARAAPAAAGPSGSIIAELKAKNVEARRGAIEKLRLADRKSQQAALPALIDLLMNEKDGQVRLVVFDIVTALGPDAAPAIPALVHTLRTKYGGSNSEESHQDYRSAIALAAVGKPAVDGLKGLLGEAKLKAAVRSEAIMALGRIGPDAKGAIPELIGLLGASEEAVGREACVALGRIGDAAIDPLIASAAGDKPAVRARAIESLGHTSGSDDRVRQAVLKGARDEAPKVRAASLKSLARLDLPADVALPVVKEDLRHDDEEVRMATVDLLLERRALLPAMVPDLASLLTAEKADVSRLAAFLLGKVGPQAAPKLIEALRDKRSRIDQIASGLAGIGRPILKTLDDSLKDPDPRVRRGSALALGQIRPAASGTAQRLAAGLNAHEPEVRADVLAAIGNLGPRAADAVPAVRKSLGDGSAEVRLRAIEFLSRAAPRDARLLADLTPLLDDPEPRVECKAIDTIRGLGAVGRGSLPAIIGKLKSPSTEVRLAATEMVKANAPSATEAVPALIALLDDPSPKLKAGAAQSLGLIGKPARPAFDRLAALVSSDQAATRESAVSAIGSLAMEADALRAPLIKALRDAKPEVRRAATRAIQKLGPKGAIFVPDIIQMAEKKENLRTVERMLRRFENDGPDVRSLPELIKQLDHGQDAVRLLAIKFLALAGENAKDAIPALERMHDDPKASPEIRKQADAASKRIKKEPAAAKGTEKKAPVNG